MNLSSPKQEKRTVRRWIHISHNLNYPLWHIENVLLPLFEKDYSDDSLRVTIDSANHIWCAYENTKCIGCALITDVGSYGGLYFILFGVSKLAQGRGVGTRLLQKIIKWSRKHGYTFIYLHTEYDNEKAIRLYEKAGFRRDFYQPDYTEQLPQHGPGVLPMMLLI
jgi:ribosomal protein S18 acetylase RimI-like enzyme